MSPHRPHDPSTAASRPSLAAREAAALLPTYARQPVEFVAGEGARLTDAEGRRYLDFLSGLAVTSLGHAHPAVADAVAAQARRLVHVSNLFYTEPQVALAERLQATLGWPDGKAFFCNSGAEANEAALKLARRWGKAHAPAAGEAKVRVVALSGGFHGRTLGALLATGNPDKHAPFEPLGEWVTHVAHDDPSELEAAVDDDVCAVWLEVVQGEGGVRPVSSEVLKTAREACDRHGALLVVDEVQTGLGRLGAWYGWQTTDVEPDVVCLAKALANGLPAGAIVARSAAAEAFGPGDHATTFGGGPVVAAAANAVVDTIAAEGLVAHAAELGAELTARGRALAEAHPLVIGIRGRGLLQALELTRPVAGEVRALALERGLVVNDVRPDALRLAPPLVIDEADLDEALGIIAESLDSLADSP